MGLDNDGLIWSDRDDWLHRKIGASLEEDPRIRSGVTPREAHRVGREFGRTFIDIFEQAIAPDIDRAWDQLLQVTGANKLLRDKLLKLYKLQVDEGVDMDPFDDERVLEISKILREMAKSPPSIDNGVKDKSDTTLSFHYPWSLEFYPYTSRLQRSQSLLGGAHYFVNGYHD